MHKLWARFGHLVQEIGKFGVVGGIAFVVDFAIYAFCLQGLGMETLTAKAIAASIAATLAFFGNRFWTWRHRERSGLAREYGLYFFFNLVGIGVALGTLALTHYGLGSIWPVFQTEAADYISAQFLVPHWARSSGSGRTGRSSSSLRHQPRRHRPYLRKVRNVTKDAAMNLLPTGPTLTSDNLS